MLVCLVSAPFQEAQSGSLLKCRYRKRATIFCDSSDFRVSGFVVLGIYHVEGCTVIITLPHFRNLCEFVRCSRFRFGRPGFLGSFGCCIYQLYTIYCSRTPRTPLDGLPRPHRSLCVVCGLIGSFAVKLSYSHKINFIHVSQV